MATRTKQASFTTSTREKKPETKRPGTTRSWTTLLNWSKRILNIRSWTKSEVLGLQRVDLASCISRENFSEMQMRMAYQGRVNPAGMNPAGASGSGLAPYRELLAFIR